jgi:imidazolonepropionase-like amidohydrolase
MPTDGDFKLITAGRLIDAKGGPPIDNGAILIHGSSIVAVGRSGEISAPEGADVQILDYPGKTIMPGMVDCHTHHNGFGDGRAGDELTLLDDEILTLQSARNARSSLYSGVTSIRENGPKNYTMFRLRDAINQGITVGPRMVLCGRPVAIIGGHMGYFGSEVTGPNESRAMTRQLIKEGADYIKVTATGGTTRTSFPLKPSFTVEELVAITDEAHKFGKLTATHCVSSQGIANSLDADVDMIIHCVYKDGDGTDTFRQDIADRIGEKGVYVNPTLHVGRSGRWKLEHKKAAQGLTPEETVTLEATYRNNEVRLEDSRKMIEMGLKVITGSDSSWGDYQLGNTVYETELLVEAGYTPMQGVHSVTSDAAKALGLDDLVGTLEAGKEADIIIVDGDPSQDINALWNVDEVFFAGEVVDRGSFDSKTTVRQPPAF